MFKIGDFSKLSQVSVKTLRYYDELDLLKPMEVDRFTSYRYYSADQLPRLNRILALKDLGLTLEEIGALLVDGLPAAQIRGILRLKQVEASERVEEERARLSRVEARLKQIEEEGKMPTYEVVVKKVPAMRVASVRDTIPTYSQQDSLWGELESYLGQNEIHPAGPCFTLYHDAEYKERDVDAEACEPVGLATHGKGRVVVRELPAVESMASVVHKGTFGTLDQAYQAILSWIQANGYRVVGSDREVYLHTSNGPARQDDPSYVTEVQIPVAKV